MTQTDRILAHLKAGRRLTPIAALKAFGCFRLAARILEQRQPGYQIARTTREHDGKHFAEYRMAPHNFPTT